MFALVSKMKNNANGELRVVPKTRISGSSGPVVRVKWRRHWYAAKIIAESDDISWLNSLRPNADGEIIANVREEEVVANANNNADCNDITEKVDDDAVAGVLKNAVNNNADGDDTSGNNAIKNATFNPNSNVDNGTFATNINDNVAESFNVKVTSVDVVDNGVRNITGDLTAGSSFNENTGGDIANNSIDTDDDTANNGSDDDSAHDEPDDEATVATATSDDETPDDDGEDNVIAEDDAANNAVTDAADRMIELMPGSRVFIAEEDLFDIRKRFSGNANEMTRRIMKSIVGVEALASMTPAGRGRYRPIPPDVVRATERFVFRNVKKEKRLDHGEYMRCLTLMCGNLRAKK